jgi:2-polyprenyl-6-methoxyphenol hydroxylase-like FAD-dependent oxidoreductase
LLIALRLGQAGIKTAVFERHTELLFSTRGCAYQPVVIEALRELGILEKVKEQAYLNRGGVSWRDIKGNELGFLQIPDGDYVLLLGQKRLNDLILKEIEKYSSVSVHFNHQYVGCEQHGGPVKFMIHRNTSDDDDMSFTADWLVGADGSKSVVRRSLCIPFEGYTFKDFRVIGTDVFYDFKDQGFSLMNYIRDPEDWCGLLFTGEHKNHDGTGPPLWRVAYPESLDLSLKQEDIMERAQHRLRKYAPDQHRFDIHRAEPYHIQQRCAAQAFKDRIILVGDALHSNNPAGGYGLTTGILDASTISKVLVQVCQGEVSPQVVTKAADDRRQVWLNVTNKISMGMYQRLASFEPEIVRQCDEYFRGLRADRTNSHMAWATVQKIAGNPVATL